MLIYFFVTKKKGDLKRSFHRYLPGRLTVFLVKKDWKIKYGFDDSISYDNLHLLLLQTTNSCLVL